MRKIFILFGLIALISLLCGCKDSTNDNRAVVVKIDLNDYHIRAAIDLYTICDDGVVCYGGRDGLSCFRHTDLVNKYCNKTIEVN